jgi:hypothetical protein
MKPVEAAIPPMRNTDYAKRTDGGFAIRIIWFSTSMAMAVSPC